MSTTFDTSTPTLPYDLYARRARSIIEAFHRSIDHGDIKIFTQKVRSITRDKPVGILGAGPGGLYAAMILDDLGIPYKILESRDRVGGRLFTHTFSDPTGAPYNYFDVGAMRFPRIDSMKRVFHLFECEQLNQGNIALKDKLRPFYFSGGGNNNTLLSYNGVTIKQNAVQRGDVFKVGEKGGALENVPDSRRYIEVGVEAIVEDVINPFVLRLLKDLETGSDDGWKYLQSFDMHSTRSYMGTVYIPSKELTDIGMPEKHLPTDVINWVETLDKGTGWYDRSLAEMILESVAFGYTPKSLKPRPTPWFCIDGGSVQIAKCMEAYVTRKDKGIITFNSRVTAIGLSKNRDYMEVQTSDKDKPYQFSHVISTIPLPVLRTIDLSGSELLSIQANALRQLNYGPSVKIGIQFRDAWWTTSKDNTRTPLDIVGGQTYTDSILRTVVYPSFGDAQAGEATTLIASYCWTEDSERLAALIPEDTDGSGSSTKSDELKKLVLRELARIHNVDVKFLDDRFISLKAWSWTNDPNTMGAFAFFGPGKFESLYQSLTSAAADGALHFAGEAISVRHAWVEGALDSAWRAVREMLLLSGDDDTLRTKFFDDWGSNPEWVGSVPAGGKKSSPTLGTSKPGRKQPIDLVRQQLKHLHPEFQF